jgi:hypothetical protein
MSRSKPNEISITAATCSFFCALGVWWAGRTKKSMNGRQDKDAMIEEVPQSNSSISSWAPKVVARVADTEELLIKKIARETSEIQRKLETSGQGSLINMSQVKFTLDMCSFSCKLVIYRFSPKGVPCLPIFEAARDAMIELIDSRE